MDNPAEDLSGRVAIITGAGSGLGWRFAQTLAACGARVVATGRRAANLERLVSDITAKGGVAAAYPLDVGDAAAIPACFEFAEARFGVVDILVNNAGIGHTKSAVALELSQVDELLGTNIRGPFLMSVECARRLIAAERKGAIVNVSSVGATQYSGNAKAALYCATKAAVSRLTETLAVEWAKHGINVNAIAPGFFRSEMSEDFIAKHGNRIVAGFPRARFGEPEYLDSTLLYLVTPHSHFVSGVCIVVDDVQQGR